MPDRLFHLVSEVDGAAGGTPAADGGGAG
jgi:hypothetical protein